MNCLLVAATALEIAPFLDHYRNNEKLYHPDKGIDVLITGVGLTATVFHLTKQLQLRRPALVIQAGIAGAFDKTLPLGTVVAIKKDAVADEGVIEGNVFKTVFALGLRKKDDFPYSKGWLVNSHTGLLNKTRLKKVNAISVNQVTTSGRIHGFYKENFDPAIESMEGAALHYACLLEAIPFLQLRSVSNYARERNKKNWKIKQSIINLNQELIRLLNTL